MKVIKLGGSVITDKENYRRLRRKLIGRLCDAISSDSEEKILIHGAGSFGHIMALRYGLERPGSISGKETGVSRVISDVLLLDSAVVDELTERGVKAVPVPPHAIYGEGGLDLRIVDSLVRRKFVPVLFGDVVIKGSKYRILSGDEIALDLSKRFHPESVVFVTDVDGIYDSDPKENKGATFFPSISSGEMTLIDGGKDATGSMAGKMERIKKIVHYTDRVVILNGTRPERLRKFLEGKQVKSTVIT